MSSEKSSHSSEINSVSCTHSYDCEIVSFSIAKPLEPCYEHFYLLSTKYSSDLFNRFWLEKVSQVSKEKKPLTFQQVVDVVWIPVFNRCMKLLDDLKSRKLILSDVDGLFKENYSSDINQDRLIQDLCNLYVGINTCNKQSSNDSYWIQSVVCHIVQYWNLCSYHEVARAFIKIRDMLQLKGDFALVETVANQVLKIK